MSASLTPRPLFMIGNKRCGTSQFVHLLNLHPEILITNESDALWLVFGFHTMDEPTPHEWDKPTEFLETQKQFGSLLRADAAPLDNFVAVQDAIRRSAAGGAPPVGLSKMDLPRIAAKTGVRYCGDKKPNQNCDPRLLPFLRKYFGMGKYLHLVRHPAVVVESSKTFMGDGGALWGRKSEAEILREFVAFENHVEDMRAAGLDILDVRFEDVTEETAAALRRAFDWLGLEAGDALLREARASTRRTLKRVPPLPAERPEGLDAFLQRYGYDRTPALHGAGAYVYGRNLLRRIRRKLTGSW